MDYSVNNLASAGLIKDARPHLLPPEAWTECNNVRPKNGRLERSGGLTQVFGTPGVAYYRAMQVSSASAKFWIMMGLAKVYGYDYTTHTDITRTAGGNYGATKANDWFGTTIGGIPVLTNGVDPLQYWSAFSLATPLAILPNWNANHVAKVIRSFGPYLVAFNITKSGTASPHMVKWSHPADPGAVPSSWDHTDPTLDAGEYELGDALAGPILDALELRGQMYIYKENSVWVMRRIGGRFVFSFDSFLVNVGVLAPHCVCLAREGRLHAVLTQDDLIVHDGANITPILNQRMRSTFFNNLDPDYYQHSFVFEHPSQKEVWIVYPENGSTTPNRALIWSYAEGGERGVLYERDVAFVSAAIGEVQADSDTWASSTTTWDAASGGWSVGSRNRTIVCAPAATKVRQLDLGLDNDGTDFSTKIQRVGLTMLGATRFNEPALMYHRRKLVTRLWIEAEGAPFMVRLGSQQSQDGSITWTDPITFDPSTMKYVDILVEGLAISFEATSTDAAHWNISSYMMEVATTGRL